MWWWYWKPEGQSYTGKGQHDTAPEERGGQTALHLKRRPGPNPDADFDQCCQCWSNSSDLKTPQGVLVCDHAGRVINKLSRCLACRAGSGPVAVEQPRFECGCSRNSSAGRAAALDRRFLSS
jgi:hypothetical protein